MAVNNSTRGFTYLTFGLIAAIAFIFVFFSTNRQSDEEGGNAGYARLLRGFTGNSTDASTKRCSPTIDNEKSNRRWWDRWTEGVRACVLDRIRKRQSATVWSTIHGAVSNCVGDGGWRMLDAKELLNWDDIKFAILPTRLQRNIITTTNSTVQNDCTVVTLGVGFDVQAELQLKQLMPDCKFYGADPSREAGSIYETKLGGTYHEIAVDETKGNLVVANIPDKNFVYKEQKGIKSMNFSDFLLSKVKRRKIDYLLMDNEGAEYRILEEFAHDGGSLERNGIVACQLSVELHGPLGNYGMDDSKLGQFLEKMLNETSMLPVWWSVPSVHLRAFFINSRNPYCVEKYFS